MTIGVEHYLVVASVLFATGALGVLLRRNTLVMFMGLELMLNAANIALVAFSRFHATAERPLMEGNLFVLVIIAIAAAEVAVGLAIIVALFRRRQTVMVNGLNSLAGGGSERVEEARLSR